MSSNKCIWYISKYFALPNKGRVGARVYWLANELSKLGHKCHVICSDSTHVASAPKLKTKYKTIKAGLALIHWVRTYKYANPNSIERILSWLHFEYGLHFMPKEKLGKPDTIIVSSLSLLSIISGVIFKKRYNARLVFEVRDIWPLTLIEEGGYKKYNPFVYILGCIEKYGYKNADAIVGTMPNLGEHVHNVLGYKKTVSCIPMGVSLEHEDTDRNYLTDYKKKYLPDNKIIVAYSGGIGISNALDVFFECASEMEENKNVHFVVIGEGPMESLYKNQYSCLKNLTFASSVKKSMVLPVLRMCDVLFFSAQKSKVWKYGQSMNKIIDYMLAEKPIIGSYSGFPSMINQADCGVFVPVGDLKSLAEAITEYAEMPEDERNAIGKRGRAWLMENQTYSLLAKKYNNIL